jgi:SAM-dependent methyltransferase
MRLQLRKKLIEYALRGNGVKCNVCERSYITFLPVSDPPIFNERCPNCWSLSRTRLTWLYLSAHSKELLEKPLKVLHFAPEPEIYKRFKNLSKVQYTPCDYFAPGYSYPADCKNVDITKIQFEDKSFDLILCAHVLEHVPDDHKAIAELRRVLKPGGKAIIQVPMGIKEDTYEDFSITEPQERIKAFGQWDHVRIYGTDFLRRLQNAGFTVEVNDLSKDYDQLNPYGLDRKEHLYICTY